MGEPGTRDFTVCFTEWQGNSEYDPADPEGALSLLRQVRSQFDEHLSTIACPISRLRMCLNLFVDDGHPDLPVKIPLLFPGSGTVEEVVELHNSMNPKSVRAARRIWEVRLAAAERSDMFDGIYSMSTRQIRDIVMVLGLKRWST